MDAPLHLFELGAAVQRRLPPAGRRPLPRRRRVPGREPPLRRGAHLRRSTCRACPIRSRRRSGARKEDERARLARARQEPTPDRPEEGAPPRETEKESKSAQEAARKAEEGAPASGPGAPGAPDSKPEVEIRIADAAGKTLRTFKAPARQGVNRAVWDLRQDAFKTPPREEPSFFGGAGPEVLPGTYTATVKYGDHQAQAKVEVLGDPRLQGGTAPSTDAAADRRANYEMQAEAGRYQEVLSQAVERIQRVRGDVATVLARLDKEAKERKDKSQLPAAEQAAEQKAGEELAQAGRKLQERLTAVEKKLWQPPGTKGIVAAEDALSAIQFAGYAVGSTYQAPTAAQRSYLERGKRRLDAALAELNGLFAKEVPELRAKVKESELRLIPEYEPLAMP